MIQDLELPIYAQQSPKTSQRKGQIRKYAKQVVRPRVQRTAKAQGEGSLPWVWMARNFRTKEQIRCFEQWWVWRIQGNPPWEMQEACPLCRKRMVPTTEHIQLECSQAAEMAEGTSLTTMDLLDLPTTPERFKMQMSLAEHYNRVWTQARNLGGPKPSGSSEVQDIDGAKIRRC